MRSCVVKIQETVTSTGLYTKYTTRQLVHIENAAARHARDRPNGKSLRDAVAREIGVETVRTVC